ncbi:MAG: IS110 family transposase [Deltaproteobacteria bacterium]|nr:IS110 family transposase [Deltaproteobacteria bacterium]
MPLPPQLKRVNLDAAGIDIGAEEHWAAVPPGRDTEGQDVRRFGAFTGELCALADWLKQCGIQTVAMESTGVYWIPLYELLVERGFEVLLVDARQAKNVPGRKTDVLDCQWLQELHTYGLLRGAFRPVDQVCILRSYLRQRSMLVSYASHHIQHMQKALEQMNLKLSHVVSDITGLTGMGIIKAILSGERDPVKLAKLRDPRCKSSEATVARALEGHYREEHLFTLQQAVELVEFYQQQTTACDRQIEACLQQFEEKSSETPVTTRRHKRRRGIAFDARSYLYRMTGIDLTQIDSIEANTALTVISEIGLDMSRWPTEKHFGSWLGLAPGSKVSGGKRLSGRTKPSANRAAAALRLAAQSLNQSQSALGAYFRRLKARLGAPKALTAAAYKLARIVYRMLKYGAGYVDQGEAAYEERYRDRLLRNLKRRAAELGFQLTAIELNSGQAALT